MSFVSRKNRWLTSAIACSLMLSACATTGMERTTPLTPQQKIAGCIATVAIGALIGGVIGNNTGSGDAGRGAAIGAGVGAGACAVWLAFEAKADQERIARLQITAAQTGVAQSDSWQSPRGQGLQYSVSPSAATSLPVKVGEAQETRVCRTMNGSATVGNRTEAMETLYCRDTDGNWAPAVRAPAP